MMRRRKNNGPLELVPCALCVDSTRHGGAHRAIVNGGQTAFFWGTGCTMAAILRDADAVTDSRGMVAITERGDVGIYFWLDLPERAVAIRYWPSVQREALDFELEIDAQRPGLRIGSIVETKRAGLASLIDPHSSAATSPVILSVGARFKVIRRDVVFDAYRCRLQRNLDETSVGRMFYLDAEFAMSQHLFVLEPPPWARRIEFLTSKIPPPQKWKQP